MASGSSDSASVSESDGDADEAKMSLMEHLMELRSRLLRFTIAVLVLGSASLVFARDLYGLLMRPVLLALPPDAASLVYTSAIEEINVLMKIGLYAGLFLSTPVLLWQIWGFVAPGLYDNEKSLAGPFILFGSLSFLAGAVFCYFVVLPQMFQFLLQNDEASAIEHRLEGAAFREEDALRFLRLSKFDAAGAMARAAIGDLERSGEGQTTDDRATMAILPKANVEGRGRLEGLGRLLDASTVVLGAQERAPLAGVLETHHLAVKAFERGDFDEVARLTDEGASQLGHMLPGQAENLASLWKLERLLSAGRARAQSVSWTRPMLSMTEQLTLVLVLIVAFGVIFELPLVMMLLGMVGIVTSAFLFKYQRHAFVVCLILAAIITPTGDVVNLSLMAGPMLLCYELGVLLVWLGERRRLQRNP